ncbi:MAG TPA: FAD-dependent oxidoreductase, partial [Solirubrobacteraceae bacterium]|nr:FAD-dependent oxidoreductase [Solirubrobacteraceae bacterium]
LALGARPVEAVPGALTFRGPQDAARAAALVDALRRGAIRRAAFVVPAGTIWPMPLYELALQAAAALASTTAGGELTVVTPEARPLAAFGEQASDAVAAMLAERGVALRTGTVARILADGRLDLGPDRALAADAAVALPRLVGPRPRGVPADALGFVPVDAYTRVREMDGVHAVGDVAAHGVKQGGLAAQQADVAAAVLAARAGAPVTPEPYHPVLRGLLLTGGGATYVRHDPAGASQVSEEMLWWPPGKVAGRHLGPYLAGRLDLGDRPEAAAALARDVAA